MLLLDTHPGLNEETLLSIAMSDALVIVLRPDHQDYEGTHVTVSVARKLAVPRTVLVVNKTPESFDAAEVARRVSAVYDTPVAAVVPHSEELMVLSSSGIFVLHHPDHPVAALYARLADRLVDAPAARRRRGDEQPARGRHGRGGRGRADRGRQPAPHRRRAPPARGVRPGGVGVAGAGLAAQPPHPADADAEAGRRAAAQHGAVHRPAAAGPVGRSVGRAAVPAGRPLGHARLPGRSGPGRARLPLRGGGPGAERGRGRGLPS